MDDEAALLRAICEFPAEDTPRLAYADWLDEHAGTAPCAECGGRGKTHDAYPGGWSRCDTCSGTGTVPDLRRERAELIRTQIDLHGVPLTRHPEMPFLKWKAAADRCSDMLARHGGGWFPVDTFHANGLTKPDRLPVEYAVWFRGFVRQWATTLADFLAYAPAAFAAHPVEAVTLTDRQPYYSAARLVSGERQYVWFDAATVEGARSHLGSELFAHLEGGFRPNPHVAEFPTVKAATDALSRAAVRFGRHAAGLPPLPVTASASA